MAKRIYQEPSRTLMEYRLLPRLTTPAAMIDKISLQTHLVRLPAEKENGFLQLNIPVVAAAMQSVSGPRLAIELATHGGVAFIFCSQPIAGQAAMIRAIKSHKAGFVEPRPVAPDITIAELVELSGRTGYSTFPVVGEKNQFLGLITRNDYDSIRHASLLVQDRMIPGADLDVGIDVTDLGEANTRLIESHQSVLPILDSAGRLRDLVFRKDLHHHMHNPWQVVDGRKRLLAGAAVNTHDYRQRVPALVEAEVDVLMIDSSDGHSFYQKQAVEWIRSAYPALPVIGGNVITREGFRYLVEAGAGAIKVGMGSGSICITQEQKGTGRGLATAVIEVAGARDVYFQQTGRYIPILADGGIRGVRDMIIALALGADDVMMGRYFARMDESPTEKVLIRDRVMKPYWGEGAARAREWTQMRYHQAWFVEGVEGLVEYAGKLQDNLARDMNKIRASMSTCGVADLAGLHEHAELELVSTLAIQEGGVHDIYVTGSDEVSGVVRNER